jgi:sugar lactone lactonase YvrE
MKYIVTVHVIQLIEKLGKALFLGTGIIFYLLTPILSVSANNFPKPVFQSHIGLLKPLEFYDIAVTTDINENIYLVNLFKKTIQKRSKNSDLVFEFSLHDTWPRNVTIDSVGNLYTIDSVECKIRKYSKNGELLLYWGDKKSQPGGFVYPQGITIDNQQNIIVIDGVTQITKFDTEGNMIWNNMNYPTNEGVLKDPQAVVIGNNGHIIVADTGNDRIAEFDDSGNYITSIGSEILTAPVGVTTSPNGDIFVHDRKQFLTDVGYPQIYKFTSQGTLLSSWGNKGHDPGELWEAHGITIGPDNSLWVAGYHGHNVVRYDLNGDLIDEWYDNNIVGGEFAQIEGARVGNNGRLYVVDFWNQNIQVFDRYGEYISTFGERGQGDGQCFNFPRFTASDLDGNIYISDDREIRKFDENGKFIARSDVIIFPGGIEIDSFGDVWVTERGKNQVRKYSSSLDLKQIISSYEIPGGLNSPYGICQGLNNKIYIADAYNHRVIRLDENGNYEMEWGNWGSNQGQFQSPVGIAIDSKGNIFISETWGDRIQVFSPEGKYLYGWGEGGEGPGKFGDIFELSLDGDYFLYAPDHGVTQGIVHKFALVPDIDTIGRPDYVAGKSLGYYIWSDNSRMWHIRWSSDGIQNLFEGTIHSTSNILGYELISYEQDFDFVEYSSNRIDFLSKEANGEDGMDIIVDGSGIITFDVKINGEPKPYLIKIGSNGEHPDSLPLPFLSKDSENLNPIGRPIYTPAKMVGYFIWQDADDGEWHIRWSGDSIRTHHFNGSITSSGGFTDVETYSYESNDYLQPGAAILIFDGYAGAGEDGIDFFVPIGSQVSFDIFVNDIYEPTTVHVGANGASPESIPFALLSAGAVADISSLGHPSYIPAQDRGYFIWQDADDGEWHIRWSGDSIRTHHFNGSITSSGGFTDVETYSYESNDYLQPGAAILIFDGYAGAGEDGIDFFVPIGSQVSFDIFVNDIYEPTTVHVGANGASPESIPFALLSAGAVADISSLGHPSYIPAQDRGYFIWQDADDGEWHIRWSGDSIRTHHFNGSITSSGGFTDVETYSYESNDYLQPGAAILIFDGYAGAGEDGIDFFVPIGSQVSFDIFVNDIYEPATVHVGANGASPESIPFALLSAGAVADISSLGHPSYIPAQDRGYFIWQDANDGEWHIRWSGDSIRTHHFNGSITSSGGFTDVETYSYESNDYLQPGAAILIFDGYAGAGEDGIDFFVPIGSQVSFDIFVNDIYEPTTVHVGANGASPESIPFALLSFGIE